MHQCFCCLERNQQSWIYPTQWFSDFLLPTTGNSSYFLKWVWTCHLEDGRIQPKKSRYGSHFGQKTTGLEFTFTYMDPRVLSLQSVVFSISELAPELVELGLDQVSLTRKLKLLIELDLTSTQIHQEPNP